MKKTARFVSIQTRQLPDLIRALQEAQAKAIAEGLLEAPSESTSAQNDVLSTQAPEAPKRAPVTPAGLSTDFTLKENV